MSADPSRITEVLPKSGLVFSQKGSLTEALARPKIMPLKSITLEKIEQMENEAAALSEKLQAQQQQGPAFARGVGKP